MRINGLYGVCLRVDIKSLHYQWLSDGTTKRGAGPIDCRPLAPCDRFGSGLYNFSGVVTDELKADAPENRLPYAATARALLQLLHPCSRPVAIN